VIAHAWKTELKPDATPALGFDFAQRAFLPGTAKTSVGRLEITAGKVREKGTKIRYPLPLAMAKPRDLTLETVPSMR